MNAEVLERIEELVPAPTASLEIDVVADGDPVRFARRTSALVNNTAITLCEVLVEGRSCYPVSAPVISARQRRLLRFKLRDHTGYLDELMVAEIVAIVAETCEVVEVRRSNR